MKTIIVNSTEIEKGIKHLKTYDSKMKKIIESCEPFNLKPRKDFFPALLRAIVGQQLSMSAAASIWKKFHAFFEGAPHPDKILNTPHEQLRLLGLSNSKAKFVKDLSQKILEKKVHPAKHSSMSDEEIIAELTQVKGIGEWTAHMYLMFTHVRLDVLPTKDLGIKKGIQKIYGLRSLPDERKIQIISKKNNWKPYNTIACWYVWRSLEI